VKTLKLPLFFAIITGCCHDGIALIKSVNCYTYAPLHLAQSILKIRQRPEKIESFSSTRQSMAEAKKEYWSIVFLTFILSATRAD